ncbi:phosphoribosylanthranilate isomerase [Ulvibacter litoralis]|uniref:N-(5'-phosphoribosyl)anthranilate isomerase n=1 Tax=Ulvibacter litoralis TaxID=227084 RepID=A0A1G7J0M0_9FLAO|nr:phosphoribosylanthranilate isomerase [Ulvibacter litoralis]GHC60396.1 N-(5'-phosphoribosyl)anthranilate isomerase [Ulvibacter litoralis]SDF18344.1 phosphoribosylanthranilate isomerase [Ulvibacter litoralis]
MSSLKLKICGIKHNVAEVANLQPDYLGFIFYEGSPRNFTAQLPELSSKLKKVGVFVNASEAFISEKIKTYQLDVIQLHGEETPEFCKTIKAENNVQVWKVFSVKDAFDFSILTAYEPYADKFLFDTKGKEKGGNGYTFDWTILKDYPSKIPFILSGGIGLEQLDALKEIQKTELPIYAIDVNSKFESQPGLKNIHDLKKFKNEL